jgi:hypothetical protein
MSKYILNNLKVGDIVCHDWDRNGNDAIEIKDATHAKEGLYFGCYLRETHPCNANPFTKDHVKVDTSDKFGRWVKCDKESE